MWCDGAASHKAPKLPGLKASIWRNPWACEGLSGWLSLALFLPASLSF